MPSKLIIFRSASKQLQPNERLGPVIGACKKAIKQAFELDGAEYMPGSRAVERYDDPNGSRRVVVRANGVRTLS